MLGDTVEVVDVPPVKENKRTATHVNLQAAEAALQTAVNDFTGAAPASDDRTAVIIRRTS